MKPTLCLALLCCASLAIACSDDGGTPADAGADSGTDGDTDSDSDADTDSDSDADGGTEYVGSIGDAVYLGPWGGAVTQVAEDPTAPGRLAAIVGADFSTGMYVSEDGGGTWTAVAVPTELSVTSLLFLETGRLVVGTDFEILVTDDFCETWTDIRNNIEEGSMWGITVKGLAHEPGAPGRLWAALGGTYSTAPIWSLTDGEEEWAPWGAPTGWATDPLNGAAYFTDIATFVDSTAGETLIFATYEESFSAGGGVFCSLDSGATWSNCSGALPGVPFYRVLLGEDGAVVAGGHIFGSALAGVWYSQDDGATWMESTDELDQPIANDIARLSGGDYLAATYGAGVWRTAALDAPWTQVEGFGDMTINSVFELAGGDLLASPEQLGVYRSADDGASWQLSSTGLDRLVAVHAGIDPADPDSAIIAVNSQNSGLGLHTSSGVDGWAPVPGLPLPRFTFVDIAASGNWYAVSDGPTTVANDGIYVSEDGGESFDFIGPLTPDLMDHVGIRVAELGGPDHLVAAGNYWTGPPYGFLMEREDAGGSWEVVWEGEGTNGMYSLRDFAVLADESTLVALAGAPLVRVSAAGEEAAIAIPDAPTLTVTDVAACAADADVWYVHGMDESWADYVYATTDGGATWADVTPTGEGDPTPLAVAVHPYDCGLAFAATTAGLYATSDGGATWAPHDIGAEVSPYGMRVVPMVDDLAAALLVYGQGGVTRVDLATEPE
jgi:hypothetical protein